MVKSKEQTTKKGMKDIPLTTIIILVAGLVIALLIVAFVFKGYRNTAATGDKINDRVTDVGNTLDEEEFTSIEGKTISGNEVVSDLRSWKNQAVCVKVVTKTQTGGTYYNFKNYDTNTGLSATNKRTTEENSTLISYATDQMQQNYINPNAQFKTELKRNSNDTIVAVVFTQQ